MVRCLKLCSVVRVTGRALTTAARRQPRALADQSQAKTKSFEEVQRERKEQAKHSVLLNCPHRINEKKLLNYLSRHGEVASHFFFNNYTCHAVVEFTNTESIDSLLAATKIPDNDDTYIVPFKSRYVKIKSREMDQQIAVCSLHASMSVSELLSKLCAAENIEDQAQIILEEHQLTDESIRLRYLVSSLVSDIATAHFPEATLLLYGSSVNSFGKMGCDLDLFLSLDSIKRHMTGKVGGSYISEYWMTRFSSARVAQQKILSFIGECINTFGPGCVEVQKILSARCPLVRFHHFPSGLHCDLTADNRIALRSSELLYIYGNIDSRVRPLVFALRCWARVHAITSHISGHWITNFSLTMMILFFLQKRSPPVIPTLNQLKSLAGKKEECIIVGNDCTFVSDLSKIKPSANTESVDKLLIEFLEFYGSFDFGKNSIDIRKGVERNKPESSPLYIHNPFEQSLNISKNVNKSQLETFVTILQKSAWKLQEQANQTSKGEKTPWGLAAILSVDSHGALNSSKRKMPSERISSLLDSLKSIAATGGQS